MQGVWDGLLIRGICDTMGPRPTAGVVLLLANDIVVISSISVATKCFSKRLIGH